MNQIDGWVLEGYSIDLPHRYFVATLWAEANNQTPYIVTELKLARIFGSREEAVEYMRLCKKYYHWFSEVKEAALYVVRQESEYVG